MNLKIKLLAKGCSVNEWKGLRRGKPFPSKYYLDWRSGIFTQISAPKVRKAIKAFRSQYSAENHVLGVQITHHLPVDKLFTTRGTINLKSKDLSNLEKPLIDLFCDKRFDGRKCDKGRIINNLCIDDAVILNLNSLKRPDKDYGISITFYLFDLIDILGGGLLCLK